MNKWQPIYTVPKDGTSIILGWPDGEEMRAMWSERPVCMLGPINGGFPPGWASDGHDCDHNLPITEKNNPPTKWRPIEEEDVCGLCGQPGADKIPHPIHWPGEQQPDGDLVHAECEQAECARAHGLLSDKEREEFLRSV